MKNPLFISMVIFAYCVSFLVLLHVQVSTSIYPQYIRAWHMGNLLLLLSGIKISGSMRNNGLSRAFINIAWLDVFLYFGLYMIDKMIMPFNPWYSLIVVDGVTFAFILIVVINAYYYGHYKD